MPHSRSPFGRYYDWAWSGERATYARIWIGLPLLLALPTTMVAELIVDGLRVEQPALRSAIFLAGMSPVPLWLGYVSYRLLRDLHAAAGWIARIVGPAWRSGWRAAWAVLRGGGKSR